MTAGQERKRGGALWGSLATALLAHALLIGLLMGQSAARPTVPGALGAFDGAEPGPGEAFASVTVALNSPAKAAEPPPPSAKPPPAQPRPESIAEAVAAPPTTAEARPVATVEPSALRPPVAATLADAFAEAGGVKGCDIAGAIQAQLQLDPGVLSAVSGWPEARGFSTPLRVLWDGRWADTETMGGGDTVEPIRKLVSEVIGAAPADCLATMVEGPLAFSVTFAAQAHAPTAIPFVLGAAHWSWLQLVQSQGFADTPAAPA